MFNRPEVKKQENKQIPTNSTKDAETVIGPSVTVKGNLNSNGNIIIEGILKGGIKTAGGVFVGNKAQITADIEAKDSHVGGEIHGNLKIEGALSLFSSAKIFGDIECSSLSVENGAIINGKCTMTKGYKPEKRIESENQEEQKK
jgi:cytoskeletal protein CcmA (bactofilin family)